MPKKLISFFFLFPLLIFSQQKLTQELINASIRAAENDRLLVWVFFTDKGTSLSKINNPETFLSNKSILRRQKVSSIIDFTDIPVNPEYISELSLLNFKVKHISKWFNGVSGYCSKKDLKSLEKLNFIEKIDLVTLYKKSKEFKHSENLSKESVVFAKYDYGESSVQLQQINVPAVHDLGFTGQNVTIALMDAGFDNLQHEVFSNMKIIAKWDFVNNDPEVGNQNDLGKGSHGTETLSVIGGFKEGQLIGPAFNSQFILAKTENTDDETPVEEDNWIAALEWADSIGVDITSTSLGYLEFNKPYQALSYTWQQMDGKTARITIAADLAVKKGITVFNSAGNEGADPSHNTLNAPADGDSVITVGSVQSNGIRSSFSSIGPTSDGRIKPDVMAMGSDVIVASSTGNNYAKVGGTSFSCPLTAGVGALILSAHPELTPMQIRDALRNTASQRENPDKFYGWGIINALAAINYFGYTGGDPNPAHLDYKLFQNYPNPFNPATKVEFYIPENNFVKLELMDMLGKTIEVIENDYLNAGLHEVVINVNKIAVSSGIYFVSMTSGNFRNTIKVMVVK